MIAYAFATRTPNVNAARMSRLGFLEEPMAAAYVDGMNLYQAFADNPINRVDPRGSDSGSPQPAAPGKPNYFHGEFIGIILTPFGTKPELLSTFKDLLEGIDIVDQIKNMGDILGSIAQGYGEAEALDAVAKNVAVRSSGEIIKQKTDSTFDVKAAIPGTINTFIKAHECTHGFSLWIHVRYDSIESDYRSFWGWAMGAPPVYKYVSHDDYIQAKLGSDPADDTGQYGQTGTGFYMPTPVQMNQMIKQAIEARGGLPPLYLLTPEITPATVKGK